MKSLLTLVASLLLAAGSAFAHPTGPGVSQAKIIELSAHRIDRLVTLGKIDASFLRNLEKIEVSVVQNQAPAYYKARISQTPPAQGQPMQLDIAFDDDGKPLTFQVIDGGTIGTNSDWVEKDAGSLAEYSLHYVLENTANPKIALFNDGASVFTLSKGTLNGQVVARGQLTSTLTTEKLNVYQKLDGTFISAEVIP